MAIDMAALLDDLQAETAVLDGILSGIEPSLWDTPTPAEGWSVRDQISHLAYFDEAATTAAVDPDRFMAEAAEATAKGYGFVDQIAASYRTMPAGELHSWFLRARARMVEVFAGLDPKSRVVWYGPPMSPGSFATARLMETWAHGRDVADALGADWPATARIRHVAEIGVRALPNSYRARGLPVPDTPVRVELTAPGGSLWVWGPDDADNIVSGPALDFCLVATQRRHHADTALVAEGPVAKEWLTLAQAFAGPPGPGRSPRQP